MTSSAEYLSKDYSGWERRSAQWAVASKRPNFMLPVLVEDCEVPVAMAHIKRCALFGLGEDDARAHLEAYLIARTGRDKERADAEALSQALGGLPLAHEQAAAYCERLGVSLAEYARRLETTPAKLLDAERDAPAEYHDRLTVAKTFALAIDQAAKLHPAAEPLVVHSALLAPEPIPIFLFSEGRERLDESLATLLADDGLDEAIAALRAFALVDRDAIPDERDPAAATETIRLHRLVRKVASGRWQGEVSNAARRGLVEATAAIYPSNVFNNPSAWPRARRLDALAIDLVGSDASPLTGVEASASWLLDRLALYRHGALALYAAAQPLFEHALAIREKALGPEHPDTAHSLNNLARLLQALGDPKSARRLHERALAIREKALGPEHPDTADSLNSIANFLRAQDDLIGARQHCERALAIREKALGPEHPDVALSLNDLAHLLQAQGDLAGARPLHERALAIREKAFGPEHPVTAWSLNNLADLLQLQGDVATARPLYERALAIRERTLGLEHPWTAASLNNLASLLLAQADLAGAQLLLERALAIREKKLRPNHPNTNRTRINLARVRLAQGVPIEALALSEVALAAHDKVLGFNHRSTKHSAGIVVDALQALGRTDEAAAVGAKYGLNGGAPA